MVIYDNDFGGVPNFYDYKKLDSHIMEVMKKHNDFDEIDYELSGYHPNCEEYPPDGYENCYSVISKHEVDMSENSLNIMDIINIRYNGIIHE